MPVYKDGNNGTFYVQCYYRDARGSKRHKTKRGFSSEVEAAVWESQFKSLNGGAMDMTFSEFVEVYASEVKPRVREHTWITKEYIINDKLVPFFGDMRMCDVRPIDLIRWQNELTEHRDADGKPWAPTYLRTVNNQLNAIFNHAERYYGLTDNPVVSATAKSAERATLSRRRRPRFPAGGATALWPPALPRAAAQGALDRGVVEVRGPDLNLQRRGALGVPGRDRPARDLPSAELREPDRHRDVLCAERGQPPRGVRGPHDCPLSGSPSPSAASASRSFMR